MPRLVPFIAASLIALLPLAGRAADEDEAALRDAGVGTEPGALLAFFRSQTTTDADETLIKKLLRDLGDDHFRVRERASGQLVSMGTRALPHLRGAVDDSDLEVSRRAQRCIEQVQRGASEALIISAARLVAAKKPAGAERVLLDYLGSADKEPLIEATLDALVKFALVDGKPSPVFVNALAEKNPKVRAAAAVALVRAGSADAVKKLLQDPTPSVRLRVGLALVDAKEKDALPVLIALLGEMPSTETGLVEDLLFRLAGEKAPNVPSGTTPEERKKAQALWEEWYRAGKDRIDLAKLAEEMKPRGFTLVVLLDAGRVVDLDAGKKPRWQITGLEFPLDVHLLPGERVLVAEYRGNKVTERNSKGEVLWEKKVLQPIVAQRLPNGNTFIASAKQLLEVDRAGKEVWSQPPPANGQVMKAARLRNGDTAVITMLGATRYYQMDRDGKIVRQFAVEQRTSGGRLEVLPSGNLLLAERDNNRVVEMDTQGKIVWEAKFVQPVAAVRLPNGNTLVTSMDQPRAVELDRKGNEVWDYRNDTRVTRAWRH